ncbi:Hypothetical_protein [Hexamita inflata]|uniref:Hypothetical_protein n=1 Tax=Hexamita inflata TaxID=28002 RepID=A0AA86TQP9_9EUKA|nr:Hypothetical protein HINF_LOCUS2165 [Hexamita inflata]CAI9914669.1 Hypothetical protein HINF_LOCUS2314 [Hexamita inflata]CAI9914671.1 Hypothetical protein HINF_LOCUS2316 [Hexamita inflata]CAI9919661.1 Hypothetical protein HINF_LOCUS7306 [Hexamita inflata]CAI9919663.1 Hypothetical protein HINF_LOCUS7308 [Hexamita inflata]
MVFCSVCVEAHDMSQDSSQLRVWKWGFRMLSEDYSTQNERYWRQQTRSHWYVFSSMNRQSNMILALMQYHVTILLCCFNRFCAFRVCCIVDGTNSIIFQRSEILYMIGKLLMFVV